MISKEHSLEKSSDVISASRNEPASVPASWRTAFVYRLRGLSSLGHALSAFDVPVALPRYEWWSGNAGLSLRLIRHFSVLCRACPASSCSATAIKGLSYIQVLKTKGSPDNLGHKAWGLLRKTEAQLIARLEDGIAPLVLSMDRRHLRTAKGEQLSCTEGPLQWLRCR